MKPMFALTGIALALCSLAVAQESAGEKVVVPARNSTRPRKLDVNVMNGSQLLYRFVERRLILDDPPIIYYYAATCSRRHLCSMRHNNDGVPVSIDLIEHGENGVLVRAVERPGNTIQLSGRGRSGCIFGGLARHADRRHRNDSLRRERDTAVDAPDHGRDDAHGVRREAFVIGQRSRGRRESLVAFAVQVADPAALQEVPHADRRERPREAARRQKRPAPHVAVPVPDGDRAADLE